MDDDLHFLYQQLRQQLDLAYGAARWDSAHIDLITGELLRLETQLARQHSMGLMPSGYLGALPAPQRAAHPSVG